jgi:hypothetical protein
MARRHILAVLCDMFSGTSIMTDRQLKKNPLVGLHTRQISILWIFTYEDI